MTGPDTLNFDVNLDNIPVSEPIIDTINNTIIPGINGALTAAVDATNTAIGLANTAINGLSTVIDDTVNPFIKGIDAVAGVFDLPTISQVTVDIPDVPKIPTSDIPSISAIDPQVNTRYDLPDVTDPGVPAYTGDLGQNEMAILACFAGLAAPVTGTVRSADFGNFLVPDSTMNLGTIFDSTMASLLYLIPKDPNEPQRRCRSTGRTWLRRACRICSPHPDG